MRVIGSGLPRTGTQSLKVALERLLGGPCYHMSRLFERLETDVPVWRRAVAGEPVDWSALLDGCVGAVDWPASVFWLELAAAFPDALIVHSERRDSVTWWASFDATIAGILRRPPADGQAEWHAMVTDLFAREVGDWNDAEAAAAAYERHNRRVRATAPPNRVLYWRADMGWEPLCAALGVPVPDEPFPHVNRTEDWRAAEQREAEEAAAAAGSA